MLQWEDINTYDKLKVWIENTDNIHEKNNDGWNALHFICFYDPSIECISLLLENGIDINEKVNNGWNALHFICCFNPSIEYISLLLESGINIHEKDNYGWNALHYICRKNPSIEYISLLLKNGINIHEKNNKNETPFDLITKDKEEYKNLIKEIRKKRLDVIYNQTKLINDICWIITDYI